MRKHYISWCIVRRLDDLLFCYQLICTQKKDPLREQWILNVSFAVLLDDFVPWQDVVEVLRMTLGNGVRC